MKRIGEFFQESSGKLSGPRAIFNLFGIALIIVWIVLSIQNAALQSIPDSVIILLATTGILKVAQKPMEKKDGLDSK